MINEAASSTQSQNQNPDNDNAENSRNEEDDDSMRSYSAGEVFVQGLAGLVNQSDVETMIRAQKQMLQRFEKTNEMISNCNGLSQSRLKGANEDFKRHVKLLTEMKKDLDYIFRKVRSIKHKLSQQYPVAYAEAQPQRSSLAEEADETDASCSVVADGKNIAETPPTVVVPVKTPNANYDTAEEETIREQAPAASTAASNTTTVEYVQMEEAIDNGKPIENELIKRVCSIETTNPNDSSDCTSEDTG